MLQSLSPVQLFATPWTAAPHASLSITNYQSLSKLMSIELVMPSNHLILCCPRLLLPSIFPSIRVSSFHQVAKVLEFQFQHQSFQRTLRIDLLYDGLVGSPCSPRDPQESSPKHLLQRCFSKASVLWSSAFFTVQLSHPYMTSEKTVSLTR